MMIALSLLSDVGIGVDVLFSVYHVGRCGAHARNGWRLETHQKSTMMNCGCVCVCHTHLANRRYSIHKHHRRTRKAACERRKRSERCAQWRRWAARRRLRSSTTPRSATPVGWCGGARSLPAPPAPSLLSFNSVCCCLFVFFCCSVVCNVQCSNNKLWLGIWALAFYYGGILVGDGDCDPKCLFNLYSDSLCYAHYFFFAIVSNVYDCDGYYFLVTTNWFFYFTNQRR
jgi:hypothetical protein